MGTGGNGLRYCVRLGKIREIESEFSRIGVRMARLWPKEVCRKFKVKNRFRNLNSDFKLEPVGPGGRIPARTPQVDSPVDLGVDLVRPSRQPCRLGCRLGSDGLFSLVHHFGFVLSLGARFDFEG